MPADIKPEVPLKKVNWKQITPTKIPQQSVWVNIEESTIKDCIKLFEGLNEKFSSNVRTKSKPLTTVTDSSTLKSSKKIRNLKVLDPKAAQNLMILFGSIKMTANELMLHLLNVDGQFLNDAILQQLILSLIHI